MLDGLDRGCSPLRDVSAIYVRGEKLLRGTAYLGGGSFLLVPYGGSTGGGDRGFVVAHTLPLLRHNNNNYRESEAFQLDATLIFQGLLLFARRKRRRRKTSTESSCCRTKKLLKKSVLHTGKKRFLCPQLFREFTIQRCSGLRKEIFKCANVAPSKKLLKMCPIDVFIVRRASGIAPKNSTPDLDPS